MMLNLLLLLFFTFTLAHGFQIQPISIRTSKPVLLGAHQQYCNHDEPPPPEHLFVVTRRQAIATTTASAVLATTTPASHAAVTSKLTTRTNVQYLEAEYADSVNTNGAPEKHLPVVMIQPQEGGATDGTTKSVLAQVNHVMDPEKPHFIEYMWIKNVDSGECVACKAFKATDPSPPSIAASIKEGTKIKAFLFCNLHGLWQGDEVVV